MKIGGAELKAFMDAGWPQPDEDWYWDHEEFDEHKFSGDPDPAVTYDTQALGPIFYQGSGPDPTNGDGYDLAALIRQWRRERDSDLLTVLVPKARVAEFKKALKTFGATINK